MAATAITVSLIAMTVSNTIAQREGRLARGNVEASIARSDARIAKLQEADALRRGERRAQALRIRKEQLIGTQKAALAAQGIQVNSGTGAAVIVESKLFGDLDILETINNARLEAFGFKANALTSEGRGRFAQLTARADARATLLTGGLSIARDLALFGLTKQRRTTDRTGKVKFVARNPTEARFQKSFQKTGQATGGKFSPGQVRDVGFAK